MIHDQLRQAERADTFDRWKRKNSDPAVVSSAMVQPWWIKVPWQNYDEMGECPQCVRCGVSMKLNSSDSEWGEDEGAIFNVCNSCAASLLPEMWQRLNA
jgi:hypothetical protein